MIKKSIGWIFLLLLFTASARAESVKFSLGAKSWLADWKVSLPKGSVHSRLGMLYGPVAIIRYQNFFLGATYLTGAFQFPVTETVNVDAERTDTDFTAGYYFNPYFGITGGYRYTEFTYGDLKSKAKGPFGGFLGSYPLGRSGFLLYGNLTYSWLSRTGLEPVGDLTGPSGELGFAYRMPTAPIIFTEGFKYQKFQGPSGTSDTFMGLILSAAYSF